MKSTNKNWMVLFILSILFFSFDGKSVSFTGQYKRNAENIELFLVIQQSKNDISGGLTSSTGADFKLQGIVQEEIGSGQCVGQGMQLFFKIRFTDNELHLQLIEPDTNGQPDLNKSRVLVFQNSEANSTPTLQSNEQNYNSNTSAAQGSTALNSNARIKVDSMGLSFIPPSQWIAKKDAQSGNYIMGSNSIPGLIIIMPHNYPSVQELTNNASQGFVDGGLNMYPSGNIEALSNNSVGSDFSGTYNGTPTKAYVVGAVSPNGGGLIAICVTDAPKYSMQHKKSAIEFVKSVNFFKAQAHAQSANTNSNWIAGKYYSYEGSTERKLTLCPSGIYYYNSEASYSGNFTDGGGNNTGAWGTANENRGDGRWQIVGNRQRGTIIFISADGSREEQSYRVGKGCIYINGVTMGYNGSANCN